MWDQIDFSDTLVKNSVGRKNQINASEILSSGKYPVIDQGQSFIAGYCNDEAKLVNEELPLIIFGDHTRCFKYVDFPFIVGADGTKALKPNTELFDAKYYYFALLSLDIPSRGYNRHFKLLKEKKVPVPERSEQQRIAYALSTVQTAIEQQERLIKLTRELKSALMQKLFTEGLRGEKQKMTVLGPVPVSWDVIELSDMIEETEQVNMRKESERQIKYIDVSSISRDHLLVETTSEYLLKDAPGRARKKVKTGDVIFATVRPTLLRVAHISKELDNQVCSTAFCVLRAKEDVSDKYIYYVVQREQFIKQLAAIESGANYPAVTDRQVKNQIIPKPKYDEQAQIAEILNTCDKKVLQHAIKKEKLEELFRTLLHQLMTGQTRVNDVDLPGFSGGENGDQRN